MCFVEMSVCCVRISVCCVRMSVCCVRMRVRVLCVTDSIYQVSDGPGPLTKLTAKLQKHFSLQGRILGRGERGPEPGGQEGRVLYRDRGGGGRKYCRGD